jgi:hypothetical protein
VTNTLAYYTKVFITSVKRFLGEPTSTEMIEKREREEKHGLKLKTMANVIIFFAKM